MSRPTVTPFYDAQSCTFSYVVKDENSNTCAIIDSVMNIDCPSGTLSYVNANAIVEYIKHNKLDLKWIIETHVHADHLSAAPYLKEQLGGSIGIGNKITEVQNVFGKVFNEGTEFERDGSQFDRLFNDEEHFKIGSMTATAMHTPGHTPACVTYVIGDAAFVGDTLFMPDGGTARADFPGGDARQLYRSIRKILALPVQTRLFMCHDYCPNGRDLAYETSVAEELENNIHVNKSISEDQFVAMREARDATLGMPTLLYPSLQVNMRAGQLPPPESNEQVYLKLPLQLDKK